MAGLAFALPADGAWDDGERGTPIRCLRHWAPTNQTHRPPRFDRSALRLSFGLAQGYVIWHTRTFLFGFVCCAGVTGVIQKTC